MATRQVFQGFKAAGFCLMVLCVQPARTQALDPSLLGRLPALNPMIEKARKNLALKQFPQVVQDLEPCLRQVPNHYEAHFLLAQVSYEGRDFQGALAHLLIAEQNLVDLSKLFQAQMEAIRVQDDLDLMEAEANYDQLGARGVDPSACSGVLYRIRKRAIEEVEARKGHLHDWEKPFEVPAPLYFLHGNTLYRLGRRDEARAQYRLAVATDPSHANAWNNLLALHLEARDPSQARADLERAEAARVVIRPELKQAVLSAK